MSDKIRAAIRVRPFLQSQIKEGYVNSRVIVDQTRKQISINEQNAKRSFHFDHLFSQADSQQDIYKGCGIDHMIDKAIEGYHSTIFAYGQTGSGKTHTMQGAEISQQGKKSQLDGLIPRIITNLFQKTSKNLNRTFIISVSFLQIYNQRIFDLLNPFSLNPKNLQSTNVPSLRLRWTKNQQFVVENLFVCQCKNAEQLQKYFIYGLKNRISSAHKLNMQSSRSHSILTIRVESFCNKNPTHLLSSKVELVDLAGSERIGQTGTEGKLAKQSIDINKSLFTLRQVISILAQMSRGKTREKSRGEKQKIYVPYRDSKLTSILKQSIGGNSYCLMIACINPHDSFMQENISTLTYATKASYITNQPVVNDDPRTKVINQLRHQVKQLNEELSRANQHIEFISNLQQQKEYKEPSPNLHMTAGQITMPSRHNYHSHGKPSTEHSQNLNSQEDQLLPQPLFKKRLTERIGVSHAQGFVQNPHSGNYDQFSQRLVQSINMVRELLKSNKQLREQLQVNNRRIDDKDIQIYELSRQNQFFKEKLAQTERGNTSQFQRTSISNFEQQQIPSFQPPSYTDEGRKSSQLRKRATVHSNPPVSSSNPPSNGNIYAFSATNSKNNFNYCNSVQINQYYMNQRGVDSMPTNFNRREVSSAQDKRVIQSRGATSAQKGNDRHAITAKISKRSWMSKNSEPKKFLSFYNDPTAKDQIGFY